MRLLLPRLMLAAATLVLAGCAALNQLPSEVSSFGSWPADRKPGSYVFERLPSQQAQPEVSRKLEEAAAPALAAAGFTPAADPARADVVVLLGARVSGTDPYLWDEPFWWRGGWFYGRPGPFWRGGFWFGPPTPTYERQVALLIRDRQSGAPLYETRASNDGGSPSIESLLPAMFAAAMKDFPATGVNPRRVVTPIDPSKP